MQRRLRAVTANAWPYRIANPTEDQVDLLHRRYFTALKEIFEKYRHVAGDEDSRLKFDTPVKPLSEKSWSKSCHTFKQDLPPECDHIHKLFPLPGDGLERLATGVFWTVVFSCIFAHAAVNMHGSLFDGIFGN